MVDIKIIRSRLAAATSDIASASSVLKLRLTEGQLGTFELGANKIVVSARIRDAISHLIYALAQLETESGNEVADE